MFRLASPSASQQAAEHKQRGYCRLKRLGVSDRNTHSDHCSPLAAPDSPLSAAMVDRQSASDSAAAAPSSLSSSPRVLKGAWLSVGVLAGLCCVVGHLALSAPTQQQSLSIAALTPHHAAAFTSVNPSQHDTVAPAIVQPSPAARRLASTPDANTRQSHISHRMQ